MWSRGFGDTGNDVGFSVGLDGAGNVFITGEFEGSVDFGGGLLTSAGGRDIFLAKYDTSGTHLWSQRFGDSRGDQGFGVGVDGTGNVFITGWFQGTVDFGGGPLTSAGSFDIFLAKFGDAPVAVAISLFDARAFEGGVALPINAVSGPDNDQYRRS